MSLHNHYLANKPIGATPLETLELLRREKGVDASVPMTYAGRLDPMAEGLLIVLVGEECKNKEQYLGLDKEYEIEVLLGLSTDTGDILGKLRIENNTQTQGVISIDALKEKVRSLIGRRKEKYPSYSSKPVNGKPLFEHAKESTLDDIDIPEKEIEIYSIDVLGTYEISKGAVLQNVYERIQLVKGDFRQNDICDSWQQLSVDNGAQDPFQVIRLRVHSSSGAYMRTLAEKCGELFGVPALAWTIRRTKVGEFTL